MQAQEPDEAAPGDAAEAQRPDGGRRGHMTPGPRWACGHVTRRVRPASTRKLLGLKKQRQANEQAKDRVRAEVAAESDWLQCSELGRKLLVVEAAKEYASQS